MYQYFSFIFSYNIWCYTIFSVYIAIIKVQQ